MMLSHIALISSWSILTHYNPWRALLKSWFHRTCTSPHTLVFLYHYNSTYLGFWIVKLLKLKT